MCADLPEPPAWLVVTGTNGKTTTVGMLAEMLLAAGLDAVACGNIGLPVVSAVAAGHRVLAVELSSFQLYWSPSVRPTAGALLNIAEDHLDWHGTMDAYAAAKARALTGPIAIGGVDEELAAALLSGSPAEVKVAVRAGEPGPGEFGVRDGHLVDRAFAPDPAGENLAEVGDVTPVGPPAVFDALTAAALARSHGVPATAVAKGLRAYHPAAHRAAAVGEIDGVRFVDDSKATNPHAAAASLRAHDRVVWIAGGLLKGARVDELVTEVGDRIVGAVLIGADREVIATALARHAPDVPVHSLSGGDDDSMSVMSSAVRAAHAMARPGDVVLLAPAGASQDMFTDYQQRGRVFAEAVARLTPERG
jgi:UDP-N-acetylmuramoylalanine--D-glutamate ligase